MEHLSAVWPEISERIRAADQILLLTDFDGTLSPIVGRPEEAVLPDDTRCAIEALAASQRVGVAVVSGRALSDIKNKVGIHGITYAGNHGIEIEGPWLKFVYPPAQSLRPVIRRLHPRLSEALAGFEGAFVEDKGLTLSVHFRLLKEDRVGELKRVCEETVRGLRSDGKIRTTEGKKVYEIRPGVIWDKEDAIVLLMSGWASSRGKTGSLAIFLGDDLTDEGGFKVVNTHGGFSIFVGESGSNTAANFFLRSPGEVEEFLRRLAQTV
ncbi:MAG: trehalose-phosphatase [Methanomicrobiales archaeon]|nr:trehalose-phosphatase [Methanomicrobiales archaeon]